MDLNDDFHLISKSPSQIEGQYGDQLQERNKFYREKVKKLFAIFAGSTIVILILYIFTVINAVTLKDEQKDVYKDFNHDFLQTWYEIQMFLIMGLASQNQFGIRIHDIGVNYLVLALLGSMRLSSIIYSWNYTIPRVFSLIASSFSSLGGEEYVAQGFNYNLCWLLSVLIIAFSLLALAIHLYMPIKYLNKEKEIQGKNRYILYILGVVIICPVMYLLRTLICIPPYVLGTFGARYKKQDQLSSQVERKLSGIFKSQLNSENDRSEQYKDDDFYQMDGQVAPQDDPSFNQPFDYKVYFADLQYNEAFACPVCRIMFNDNDEVTLLNCQYQHLFHRHCAPYAQDQYGALQCPECKEYIYSQ